MQSDLAFHLINVRSSVRPNVTSFAQSSTRPAECGVEPLTNEANGIPHDVVGNFENHFNHQKIISKFRGALSGLEPKMPPTHFLGTPVLLLM